MLHVIKISKMREDPGTSEIQKIWKYLKKVLNIAKAKIQAPQKF